MNYIFNYVAARSNRRNHIIFPQAPPIPKWFWWLSIVLIWGTFKVYSRYLLKDGMYTWYLAMTMHWVSSEIWNGFSCVYIILYICVAVSLSVLYWNFKNYVDIVWYSDNWNINAYGQLWPAVSQNVWCVRSRYMTKCWVCIA